VGSSKRTWNIISLHVLYMYTNNRAHANSNKADVNKTCNRLDAPLSSTRSILQHCTFVLEWQHRLFKQQPKHNHRQVHLVCDALNKSYWLRQEVPQGSASEPSAEASEVSVRDVNQLSTPTRIIPYNCWSSQYKNCRLESSTRSSEFTI
jgi:hypothetical protein